MIRKSTSVNHIAVGEFGFYFNNQQAWSQTSEENTMGSVRIHCLKGTMSGIEFNDFDDNGSPLTLQ
jgi:hypothetical protein